MSPTPTHPDKYLFRLALPEFELPPSPALPPQSLPAFPPYVKAFEVDPENLRLGVTQDLTIIEDCAPTRMRVTTHVIRSVRNYILSLPDEHGSTQPQQGFRPTSLSTSEPQKRRVSSGTDRADPLARIRRAALDVLIVLRELEESARVPLSDDAYDAGSDDHSAHSRVASPSELSDVPTEASFSVSIMQVGGRRESILVWDEEEDDFNVDEESERGPRERWDERLVLGSGWLYRQDLRIDDLDKQQSVIGQYLDTVDDVLFGGRKDNVRGWVREQERLMRKEKLEWESRGKVRRSSAPAPHPDASVSDTDSATTKRSARRVVSANMLDEMRGMVVTEEPEPLQSLPEEDDDDASSVDDEELPQWAKRGTFAGDPLARTHALLAALLPASLLPKLPPSSDRAALLEGLSSGQLLCTAYNTGVRQSRKPWGYISQDSIHDILALENALAESGANGAQAERGRKGWTFRRSDNLRLWGAALKLRYMLPIISPASPDVPTLKPNPTGVESVPTSPSATKFPGEPIFFDARVVARKEDGWEDMLERVLLRWTSAVVEECRGDSR
ncbi:hypothetical protein BC834DRAFT_1043661 [Gloeopeniophorella convolvens]|nr:hypothetical protein BC834DRAFT_1043661 [Gloeopeniophorella convolvens]